MIQVTRICVENSDGLLLQKEVLRPKQRSWSGISNCILLTERIVTTQVTVLIRARMSWDIHTWAPSYRCYVTVVGWVVAPGECLGVRLPISNRKAARKRSPRAIETRWSTSPADKTYLLARSETWGSWGLLVGGHVPGSPVRLRNSGEVAGKFV